MCQRCIRAAIHSCVHLGCHRPLLWVVSWGELMIGAPTIKIWAPFLGVWMVKSWHSFPGLLVVYWGGRNNWTEFGRCIWFQLWGEKPKQDLSEFSATRFTGLNSMMQKSMADFRFLNFELTEKEKHPVWLYDVAQKHPGGCETARAFWGFAE